MHLDNIQDLKAGFVGASGVEKIAIAKLVLSERNANNTPIPDDYEQDIFIKISRMIKVLGSATTSYLKASDIADTVASEYEQGSEAKGKVSDSDYAKLKESAAQYIKKCADAERALMFDGKSQDDGKQSVKTIYVTKIPSVETLKRAFSGWGAEKLSDKDLIEATKQALTANYMQRRVIEPKGATWGNRTVLSEAGKPELINKLQAELKRRGGLGVEFDIEIEKPILDSATNPLPEQIAATKSGLEAFDLLSSLLSEKPIKQDHDFIKWALEHAQKTEARTDEIDGVKYEAITKTFTGSLNAGRVKELSKQIGSHPVNEELRQVSAKWGGKYVGQGGDVTIMETVYKLVDSNTKQAEQSALFGDDDLNPNSPNYRYRDTGYIAGSKKELAAIAAEMIKKASKDGDLVRASSIDFDSIENNPREAKTLITKSNLLGKIDWQKHKDSGMKPAAAFLIDRVLFAIPKEPTSDTAQARHDYAIGIETLRDRLELCKTPDDVLRLIDEVREEWAGTVLSADESEQYKVLYADYLEKYKVWSEAAKALRDAEFPLNRTLSNIEYYERNLSSAKRGRDPFGKYFKSESDKQEMINGCIEKIAELQALKETQQKELNAYKAAHPEISEEISFTFSNGENSRPMSELDFVAEDARRKADAIKKTAEIRNKEEGYSNQAIRSWQSFGDGFKKLLKYRYRGNSQSFFDHVNNALGGKPDNWEWAIKTEKPKDTEAEANTDTAEEKKKRTQFQLKVSDSYERVGGRQVEVKSTIELKNLFGLRDVQSGNYVLNDKSSAEFHVTNAAAAFADLADLIGVEDHLISMKGNLALAFGARGTGRALAHYEPVQRVINITKMKGGGSLAHEWFHAMDNMMTEVFSGTSAGVDTFLTENPEAVKHPELTRAFSNLRKAMLEGSDRSIQRVDYTAKDYETGVYNFKDASYGMQLRIKEAGNLTDAAILINDSQSRLKNWQKWLKIAVAYYDGNPNGGSVAIPAGQPVSKFLNDAILLDKGKSGAYWSQPLEMAARAFAGWTEERLGEQGRKNHYLSNHSNNEAYAGEGVTPYPDGDEKKRIYAAFDDLFKVIRETGALQQILDSLFSESYLDSADTRLVDNVKDSKTGLDAYDSLAMAFVSPLVSEKDYHYSDAQNAYQHSNRSAALAGREHFVKSINGNYEKLNVDLNPEQKKYLDKEFIALKPEYLEKEKSVFSAASNQVSWHIAGRDNFKSSLATRGETGRIKADSDFASWFDSRIADIASGIKNLRSTEQVKTDDDSVKAIAIKKAKKALIRDIAYLNTSGWDKSSSRKGVKKSLDAFKAIDSDEAKKYLSEIDTAFISQGKSLMQVVGAKTDLWKEINVFLNSNPILDDTTTMQTSIQDYCEPVPMLDCERNFYPFLNFLDDAGSESKAGQVFDYDIDSFIEQNKKDAFRVGKDSPLRLDVYAENAVELLDNRTLSDLKILAGFSGLSKSGQKAELIDRILKFYKTRRQVSKLSEEEIAGKTKAEIISLLGAMGVKTGSFAKKEFLVRKLADFPESSAKKQQHILAKENFVKQVIKHTKDGGVIGEKAKKQLGFFRVSDNDIKLNVMYQNGEINESEFYKLQEEYEQSESIKKAQEDFEKHKPSLENGVYKPPTGGGFWYGEANAKKALETYFNDTDYEIVEVQKLRYVIKEKSNLSGSNPVAKTNTIQDLKSQFPANNGMGKIALAKLILQARAQNAPSTNEILERDSQTPRNTNNSNEKTVFNDGKSNGTGAGISSGAISQAGNTQQGNTGLSANGPAVDGTQSDSGVVTGDGDYSPARTPDSAGSDQSSQDGIQPDRATNLAIETATRKTENLDRATKARLQAEAENIDAVFNDEASIRETLPFLLYDQQTDVVKIEKRLAEANGMMITNGTGTGKTATALGAIKRFAKMGKDSILIVVPRDKILVDFIDFAKNMHLTIKKLDGTKDNGGSGIGITTYANFYQNESLMRRDWDLVVFDEAHYINSNAAGDETEVQSMMRRITNHKGRIWSKLSWMKDNVPEIKAKMDDFQARKDFFFTQYESTDKIPSSVHDQIDEISKEQYAYEESLKAELEAKQSKVIFLSATPFAYEKNIDYAEGYLFDYGNQSGDGYNSGGGYENFMMQNFGYTMRTNKLTQPDAGVNSGAMQRQFNEMLKEKGALSGRALKVEADYSREFIILKDKIGQSIDEAFAILRDKEFEDLNRYIHLTNFDYLAKLKLLEAIKAKSLVPRIKKHLALGRKVVLFHSYKVGGARNPFFLNKAHGEWNPSRNPIGRIESQFELFKSKYPKYAKLDLNDLESPIETFKKAFAGDVMIYNGDIAKKQILQHANDFNDDSKSKNIILMQVDKGKEGVSLHDTTGKTPRVLINLGLPTKPTDSIQIEGRIYRTGQITNAIFEYISTGTQFEKRAFSEIIAQRSSTAENLALGSQARNLLQGFTEGYLNATEDEPNEQQGTGGKQYSAVAELSPFEKAKSDYFATQKANKYTKGKGVDYFPTPEPIGLKMVQLAQISAGESALEPSAGHGAIARYFPENAKNTFIEPSSELTGDLSLRTAGSGEIKQTTFEGLNIVNKFDAIVMNPPFGKGGSTAIEHLSKAVEHLRDGGRIVALIPNGGMADKRFTKFMSEMAEPSNVFLRSEIILPSVAFERAGTSVSSRIVVLDRIDDEEQAIEVYPSHHDLSRETDINGLFDRIQDLIPKDRPKALTEEMKQARKAAKLAQKNVAKAKSWLIA